MFHSQLSLFIAPSAGRMAVTLSPGSAAALLPLTPCCLWVHLTPHFFPFLCFPWPNHLPLPAPFFPLPTHIPLLIPWHQHCRGCGTNGNWG